VSRGSIADVVEPLIRQVGAVAVVCIDDRRSVRPSPAPEPALKGGHLADPGATASRRS
jgi:hypothetical protein